MGTDSDEAFKLMHLKRLNKFFMLQFGMSF